MGRLTEDSITGEAYIKQCASSCPYDGDFCGTDECPILNAAANKLGEYERAEEQGLLVRLPCKIGTEVYYILGIPNKMPCTIDKCVFELSDVHKIGESLFLTREEAEKKLEEMEK